VRWEKYLLELDSEELSHGLGLVHAEIVHDHDAAVPSALLLQLDDEGHEGVACVAAGEGVGVKQSSLCTYGPDHGDIMPPLIRQLHPHAILQPDSGWRLPQVECRFIDVDYLNVWGLDHDLNNRHGELLLLLLQLLLLLVLRAIHDLRLDELRSKFLVDAPHGHRREPRQISLNLNQLCTLSDAEMSLIQ
jgi:hypothetical protein